MKFSDKIKANYYLIVFSISKIPLLWFCRPKIISISSKSIEIKIPLKRRTKNHLNSMYFGALSVGADITGGFLAMMCIQKTKKKVALIFKDFKADFLKRAEGDVHFVCNEGKIIQSMINDVVEKKIRVNQPINVIAYVPDKLGDEPVAKFSLTLSIKAK